MISTGAQIAILHGEDRLSRLKARSDVDLVSDQPAADLLLAASESWERSGLFPIVLWPYDVGGTGTIFLANIDASEGVQIDVLHDELGYGQYGFKSAEFLRHVVPGESFPRLNEQATKIYVDRKRQVKGSQETAPGGDQQVWRSQRDYESLLVRDYAHSGAKVWARLRRLTERATHPIGIWVHVAIDDEEIARQIAEQLAARMGRYLPHVRAEAFKPMPETISWWVRSVAPVRWRPGVFFSWSASSDIPDWCDIAVKERSDLDTIAEMVVRELRARLLG